LSELLVAITCKNPMMPLVYFLDHSPYYLTSSDAIIESRIKTPTQSSMTLWLICMQDGVREAVTEVWAVYKE
jgi:hypothetical protein